MNIIKYFIKELSLLYDVYFVIFRFFFITSNFNQHLKPVSQNKSWSLYQAQNHLYIKLRTSNYLNYLWY